MQDDKKKIFSFLLLGTSILLLLRRTSHKEFTEQDAKQAIQDVENKYGYDRAVIIEKILRAETNHFKSEQYKETGTAGMKVSPNWGKTINKLPIVKIRLKNSEKDAEDTGNYAYFYVFPSVTYFAYFLSDYIDRHNGDYLTWRSRTNQQERQQYSDLLDSIDSRFA